MRLPTLNGIPARIDRWDMHRFVEATLAGLRSDPPDGLLADWDETTEEVLRLLHEIEDDHSKLRPEDWRHPWGSTSEGGHETDP